MFLNEHWSVNAIYNYYLPIRMTQGMKKAIFVCLFQGWDGYRVCICRKSPGSRVPLHHHSGLGQRKKPYFLSENILIKSSFLRNKSQLNSSDHCHLLSSKSLRMNVADFCFLKKYMALWEISWKRSQTATFNLIFLEIIGTNCLSHASLSKKIG